MDERADGLALAHYRSARLQGPAARSQRLDQLARELPARAWRNVRWRERTRGAMQRRFARVPVWASHGYTQRQHQAGRTREWLLVEWPRRQRRAHLGDAPGTPTLKRLVGLARERWRVEQDYRELEEELGLWTTTKAARGWAGTTT